MALNSIQSSFEELKVDDNPKEVIEQFYDFFNNIPFIQNLTKSDRKRAKDLPRDAEGKIEINITEPHILEDMDYFRPSAIHFQKYGCYTKLRPNPNPNSEFGKWLRTEVKRSWYGYVRPSDGEWIPGDYYYYLNYCPIQLIKKLPNGQSIRTIDFPRVWDGQYLVQHYLYKARLHGHHASELASRGKGKAHPYDEIVYTPEGKKKWKDIKIGDFLFGDDGSLTQVTDIPFDGKAPIYEVELSSGHKIRCSEGHLWKVNSHCRGNIIISTKELLGLYKRPHKISPHNPRGYELDCTIPKGEGAEFPYIQTKVDPYTFGLLLGDGSFRNPGYKNAVYFTAEDKDFAVYKTFIPYTINKVPSGKYSYSIQINGIYDILDIYGLSQKKSEDKFIPDEYKYNSKAVRVAILKGLLDADGTVSNGKIELVLSSKRMIKDVRWICASLGIPCTDIRIKKTWYYGENRKKVECLDAYRLSIFSDINLFNLPRKTSQWSSRSKTAYAQSKYKGYKITNITYIGEQQAKCVTVDNESHCYLINEFIVTHNSFMGAGLLAKRFKLGENAQVKEKVQSVVTASDKKYIYGPNQILNMFKYYIDFQSQHTQFPRQLLTDLAQLLMWESGFKDKETGVRKGSQNAVIGVTTGVNQDKLNGSRGVLYLIEEAGIFSDLGNLYQMIRPSVEDGKDVYGLIFAYGCVCAGTKVWTNDGRYINIEDLKREDGIIGYQNNKPVKNTIGTLLEPRYKQCVRITFNNDSTLECSLDHPILTQKLHTSRVKGKNTRKRTVTSEFIQACALKPNDKVLEGRYINTFGTDTLKDARLVGMLIGDGSYGYDNTPKYSSEDAELLNYVKDRYEWGVSAEHITKTGKIYQDIRVKNICPMLREIGIYGQTKEKKRLPYNYQSLTKKDTLLLLAGLYDTDGCITGHGDHANIVLTQANIDILQQVSILLRKFGIVSTINKNKPSIKEGRKDKNPWYNLVIAGRVNIELFFENIPLIHIEKISKLRKEYEWFKQHPIKKVCCYSRREVIVRKVKKVEFIGKHIIYNLSAEQSHTYLANNIITHNTAGDENSNFTDLQEMMYNPDGYNMEKNLNVWDKEGQGRKWFTFFYPAYLNRANCMDENGNSNVTKALLEICQDRYTVKYNSSDINAITKRISQYPITPQEAIIRAHSTIFPVTELNERLNQIDNNPNFYNDTYVGNLVFNGDGEVEFVISNDKPIRDFPTKDNKIAGAIEIFALPEKDSNGKIPNERYIAGADPYDDDASNTMSLGSFFVLDTWTDTLVMEYTGRPPFANDYFEICRKGCLFYNAKLMYENNKKGLFSYFSMMNSSYLLANTPEYLKDKQLIKDIGYGNKACGINATTNIKGFGFQKIRDWLLTPYIKIEKDQEGHEIEVSQANLYRIKNRALLKELILWNPNINVDRIMAMVQLILYREEKMVLYGGNMSSSGQDSGSELADDPFFTQNYDARYIQ